MYIVYVSSWWPHSDRFSKSHRAIQFYVKYNGSPSASSRTYQVFRFTKNLFCFNTWSGQESIIMFGKVPTLNNDPFVQKLIYIKCPPVHCPCPLNVFTSLRSEFSVKLLTSFVMLCNFHFSFIFSLWAIFYIVFWGKILSRKVGKIVLMATMGTIVHRAAPHHSFPLAFS